MSSYYDAFGGSSGPPDPFEDEEPRRIVPANRLVSTFIRPGLAEYDRQADERRDAEMEPDAPEYKELFEQIWNDNPSVATDKASAFRWFIEGWHRAEVYIENNGGKR